MTQDTAYIAKYRTITHAEMVLMPVACIISFLGFLPVWLLIIYSRKKSEIRVYSDRVERVSTFFRTSVQRIEASKIESVDFNEGIIGKKNYGSVSLRGSGMRALAFTPIERPEELAEAIRRVASSPTSKNKSNSNASLGEKLLELQKLKEQGVLTEEEFEKAKNSLL